jgi:hypothetical protein
MGNPLRIVLLVLSSLMLLACSTSVRTQPGMLRIEPVDLFAGEDKKFKPFLGVMSGAVKVSYEGKKEAIRAVFDGPWLSSCRPWMKSRRVRRGCSPACRRDPAPARLPGGAICVRLAGLIAVQ